MGSIAGIATVGLNDLDLCTKHPSRSFFRALFAAKAPITLDGYLMPCKVQGYMMFSQSFTAPLWARIPVGRVRELEWLGHGAGDEIGVERVRITL